MWTTLALILALEAVPGQTSALTIANDRFTYGHLGATRKSNEYLPGDVVELAYEVQGLKADGSGKFSVATTIEALDPAGKKVYRQGPRPVKVLNYLGGKGLPAVAHLVVPPKQPPGEYTLKVTVEDANAKTSTTLAKRWKVLPAGFGIVQVATTAEVEAKVPVAPVSVIGGAVFVNFAVVGFQRDKGTKQPNLDVSLTLLDDKGKPTMAKPIVGKVTADVPADLPVVPLQFAVTLNRVGSYTVELSATDTLSGKSAKVSFPLKVVDLN
jgi:hypothetical protein